MNTIAGTTMALTGALLSIAAGCASVKVASKHEPPVLQTTGRLVIAMNCHPRLENFSNHLEAQISAEIARRGIEVLRYTAPGIAPEQSAVLAFAKANGGQRALIYAVGYAPADPGDDGGHHAEAVFHADGTIGFVGGRNRVFAINTDGALIDVQSGKPIWNGSVDSKDESPLPGVATRAVKRITQGLIQKLVEDGFIEYRAPMPE